MRIQCQAILFDLDGVLVDSRAVIRRHWTRWAEENGRDIEQVLAVAHGRRPADTMRLLRPEADDPDRLAAEIVAGEASDAEGMIRLPGVRELITSLPAGRWTVATSGPRPIAEFRLRFAGVLQPPTMVTAEDVAQGKPDPAPYRLAASRLSLPAEDCLVIEDAPPGVRAGVAAGATVIGLATTHSSIELREAGASTVAQDLSAVQAAWDAEAGLLQVSVTPSMP
ncbi:MAG: HAD family hydrolase [Planctomycetales bacterium]|nr:HAD family hydrolase [Planctomycetales bacterium]